MAGILLRDIIASSAISAGLTYGDVLGRLAQTSVLMVTLLVGGIHYETLRRIERDMDTPHGAALLARMEDEAAVRRLALLPAHIISIPATSPKEEVVELLETRKLASIPVVDFEGRLLGIIR